PVATGLAYTGILAFAYSLVNLPFSIYATFGIEARFGFNRTTPRTYVADRIRGLALSTVLGAPLLAAVLALFGYAGAYAWLYVWAAVTVFGLVMQFIVPTWIMPLFNKFTPLGAGELKDAILSYASSVGYPLDKVFVMDASRRSNKSNAFLTGFGRNRRIVLFDTLVQGHTVPEAVAVLAHEIGHHKKRHILQGLLVSIAHAGLVLLLLSLVLPSPTLYQAFYLDKPSIYAGLLFFGLLYAPLELMLSMGMLALSRRNEYEADRFAARTTRRPQDMVSALKKLFANNLANLSPHPFYVFLNYSHPPLLQRVQAIESVQMGR
ncbi:MAG: M48 family metallopeptidase, partial [Chloroflexi bacterium]|nr:M48 family metallopeptidase [Chloroflexota bacterium]